MKLLLLSELSSIHTIRWARSLAGYGLDIHIFGFYNYDGSDYSDHANIHITSLGLNESSKDNILRKLNYLKALSVVKRIYREFQPDIVHAHYASSYGLIGSLLNKKNYIISVWGSDVYNFPNKNFLNREILKRNFKSADLVLSTSEDMAVQTSRFYTGEVVVTPFGVDTERFRPMAGIKSSEKIIIGTIKSLEHIYGIDVLIKAFAEFQAGNIVDAELHIYGKGSQRNRLEQLAYDLKVGQKVHFFGYLPNEKVPDALNGFDIFAALSRSESFGVAVVEAAACGLPSVVTDAGGLKEVVVNDETGIVVRNEDHTQASLAFMKLFMNADLRNAMGVKARKRVLDNYDWSKNVKQMLAIYKRMIT